MRWMLSNLVARIQIRLRLRGESLSRSGSHLSGFAGHSRTAVGRDRDVVVENLRVVGVAEQAGAADDVGYRVGSHDRPLGRLSLAALPDLAPQHGLVVLDRGAELHRVPDVFFP